MCAFVCVSVCVKGDCVCPCFYVYVSVSMSEKETERERKRNTYRQDSERVCAFKCVSVYMSMSLCL